MITAQDVLNKVKENGICHGIDDWILDILTPRFVVNNGAMISISVDNISARGWSENAFIEQMRERGFRISVEYPDRPCASGYYEIGLVGII
jgi:hypothetical protein